MVVQAGSSEVKEPSAGGTRPSEKPVTGDGAKVRRDFNHPTTFWVIY